MYGRVFNILIHLAFWAGAIIFLTISSLSWGGVISPANDTFFPQLYGAMTNALIFYGVCFYLLPRFFNTQRKRLFYLFSIAGLLVITVGEIGLDYLWWSNQFMGNDLLSFFDFFGEQLIYVASVNMLYYLFAFGYRFPINKRQQEQKEQTLVQERLNAELKYLKAQLDPHTLFNGMNTIYHLIDREPEKAKDIVLRFSNLIRYQLYECNEPFIEIEQEVAYLHNYLKINSIRKEQDAIIEIDIDYTGDSGKVAPLIFTPFIENAFKYLSSKPDRTDNLLRVSFLVEEAYIIFNISNTVDKGSPPERVHSGIGIKNSVNRLNLLYGSDYNLKYGQMGETYQVYLKLPVRST